MVMHGLLSFNRLASCKPVGLFLKQATKKNPTGTGRTDGATKLINEKVFLANLITVLIKKQENCVFFCNFLLKIFVMQFHFNANLF
jgi:hypothetical protein